MMDEEITLDYLKRTDTALSKILNSLSEGAYIVTPDREVIFWNKGAEAITGYSAAEICGLKCRDNRLNHYDMEGNLLCENGECPAVVAFRKGEHINSKIYVVHKSGQRVPVATNISPITDKNGNLIAIIEIFTDISKEEELRQLEKEFRERIDFQLKTTAKIQSLFQPKLTQMGNGSHVWAKSIPAALVGGDLYDVIPLKDGSQLFYVADVSGKGLPAALIMSALWTHIRSEIYFHDDLKELLQCVNEDLHSLVSDEGYFATIVIGKYWPASGKMELSRAGHPAPFWISDNRLNPALNSNGVSLGVVKDAQYTTETLLMSPGDSMIFVTDGFTEAINASNEFFGQRQIVELIRVSGGPPWGKRLLEAVKNWQKSKALEDDLTILEIWRDSS
jgi:PAS domain S-box-containing protein